MRKVIIGQSKNGPVKIDPFILADTRGLICASSGAGKSWLLRRMAELVASGIQTILIDPEGEFPSLREKLDLLIVSESGDIQADVKSAGLLARKLAETGVSAVIDIYDIPGKADPWTKRRAFLAEFITALMNLPKKSYHPMLVIIDEAHNFAAEDARDNDSRNLEEIFQHSATRSRSAVRSLMSAGRKRGFGGILATQRISKIDKDSIADARNIFIGGTTLDIDQKRAGDILGFNKTESTSLRDLDPGEFYSFGPCLEGKGIIKFRSGTVETTHPKAGQRSSITVPKASEQIESIAAQFGDLPLEAMEEIHALETLQRDNQDLRRQLSSRPVQIQPKEVIKEVTREIPIVDESVLKNLATLISMIGTKQDQIADIAEIIRDLKFKTDGMVNDIRNTVNIVKDHRPQIVIASPTNGRDHTVTTKQRAASDKSPLTTEAGITGPMQRILNAIAWMESIGYNQPSQVAIAFLAGYTYGGGGYNNPRGALNTTGLIEYLPSNRVQLTEAGRKLAEYPNAVLTTQDLHEKIFSVLDGPQSAALRTIIRYYPGDVSKEEAAKNTINSRGQPYTFGGGGFNNPMGRLHTLGLIDYTKPGRVRAADILFLDHQ